MEDEYIVEEFSDEDYDSSSSDDEVQTFIKRKYGLIEVEDDFETEVDKVMTAHMQKLKTPIQNPENTTTSKEDASENSDSTTKQAKINDELFYDPDMDDEDEKWMNEKRRSYIFPASKENSDQKLKPLPNSDAVLNCPACLSLLCMDCQRHEIYKSQFRAMFVNNCKVVNTETLTYPKKKRKFKKENADGTSSCEKEVFNPVRCSVCNTEVGVYDAEEIYHFFNVLASY
ncbi:e2F-associated phosphoprotein [Trichonephila inaurata madagascariensis]|uniref:E2F-associated phosphoprotein n=1 Tax=Trichonephila inaurata madagascariensis TaxID=2747483 RepID=A0A8X6MIW4_9ARAC|nr:e2F-associated phosphoprotein [Trichonephila inaurata madagascariensis]